MLRHWAYPAVSGSSFSLFQGCRAFFRRTCARAPVKIRFACWNQVSLGDGVHPFPRLGVGGTPSGIAETSSSFTLSVLFSLVKRHNHVFARFRALWHESSGALRAAKAPDWCKCLVCAVKTAKSNPSQEGDRSPNEEAARFPAYVLSADSIAQFDERWARGRPEPFVPDGRGKRWRIVRYQRVAPQRAPRAMSHG